MRISILTLSSQRDRYIDKGRETVTYEKPDVVIHPFPGGQYKYDFIKQCKEFGIEVIVRRGEAGMGKKEFEVSEENSKTIILGNWDYSPYVDLELTWGQEFTDIIAEQGHMPAEKLKSCGAFAFDPYFLPDCRRNENHEKTILFATGFSTCDCRSEYCECGLPDESDYHEKIYSIHRKARDDWIRAIKDLVHWFGLNWRFELKVRPGEMEQEYIRELPDVVKIHPQRSSSSEVLKNIDILVHSGSTMAIEAHLMNIPSFDFCNVNPDPLLSSVSPRLETYEELEWNLARANIQQSNINEDVLEKLEEHLYGKIDGKACERAAKYIHEHIKDKEIETDIPNTWPKTTKYLEEGIHLEKQDGDARWLCPCCRNYYFAEPYGITRCPYCSMQITMTKIETQGVLK